MIPPWTLVLGYEHAVRKFANKLVSQEGYKFGEALKKAWKDAMIKERHFISPLSLYGKRSADGPPATPPRSPARAARKAARKGALKAPRASHIPISPARAPPGRPITSPFASATMPKEDARRALSPASPMCADMLRDAPATPVHLSGHQGGRYAMCECLTWDVRDASERSAAMRVLYLFSGTPRKWGMQSCLKQL